MLLWYRGIHLRTKRKMQSLLNIGERVVNHPPVTEFMHVTTCGSQAHSCCNLGWFHAGHKKSRVFLIPGGSAPRTPFSRPSASIMSAISKWDPNCSWFRRDWSLGVRARLVPGSSGPNWTLGRSGPIGPWAVRAQLNPGLFGPNRSLGRSGPIGHWAVRAQLVPGPFGRGWACPYSRGHEP